MCENISDIDYKQVIEYSLEPLIIHSELKIIYVNHACEKFFRANKEEIIGASPLDIFKETSKGAIETRIQSAYDQPAEVIEETIYRMDGTTVDVELYCHPVLIGKTKAIQTFVRDISKRRESDNRQLEMRKQINELSTTLVPLLNGIAVLPLLGSIDEERAFQILENLPNRVQEQNVESLIIDFSGIYKLDNVVTENVFKITNVLSLLGVRTIITGLRPKSAIYAVQSGTNLNNIQTMATVKEALLHLGDKKQPFALL
ncbi:PAS domain S-box-containing protein [Fictibacillus solisalsi]|uniref:PAS domain S-box-containing protein n=1 Tax=Fictibacillus solisalsi TaxID=459525 RepID=A0A1G9WJJ6_9BACL|nr:PAS domain S-box protein [Fictibacillus solisalsi]SDM84619.1 PAS domain S-box-containing protein [Fictibacillus solisalsi]